MSYSNEKKEKQYQYQRLLDILLQESAVEHTLDSVGYTIGFGDDLTRDILEDDRTFIKLVRSDLVKMSCDLGKGIEVYKDILHKLKSMPEDESNIRVKRYIERVIKKSELFYLYFSKLTVIIKKMEGK